jgi:hypothetical protein
LQYADVIILKRYIQSQTEMEEDGKLIQNEHCNFTNRLTSSSTSFVMRKIST